MIFFNKKKDIIKTLIWKEKKINYFLKSSFLP
jgi:hypothetical protein